MPCTPCCCYCQCLSICLQAVLLLLPYPAPPLPPCCAHPPVVCVEVLCERPCLLTLQPVGGTLRLQGGAQQLLQRPRTVIKLGGEVNGLTLLQAAGHTPGRGGEGRGADGLEVVGMWGGKRRPAVCMGCMVCC